MIEYKLSLASSGAVKTPGYEDMLRFGYNKNCGVYRLRVTAADEWKGMKLRVFWHTPEGDPPASLVENGVVEVPAFVTAVSGEGRITFEGSDDTRTITSADMRYRVAANSGTEDGTMPPLGTPAWQQLVGRVEEVGADARKSAEQARKSMKQAESEKSAAAGSAAAAAKKLKELQDGIAAGDFKAKRVIQAREVRREMPDLRGLKAKKATSARQAPLVQQVHKVQRARLARRVRRATKATPVHRVL